MSDSKQKAKDVPAPKAWDSNSEKANRTLFKLNGLWVSYAHSFFATSAFLAALVTGCMLHYNKIVTNEHYTYPDEWFPSVSATIGDRYPERSLYQLLIALTSSSRFILCYLTYYLTNAPNAKLPFILLVVGVIRTFTCGGWTYVTSTDDHDIHDIFMIAYIVLTLPYTIIRTILTPKNTTVKTLRIVVATMFFGTIVPLVYMYLQHKIHRKAGAYTIYAFLEWSLVLLDILFDSLSSYDLPDLEIVVQDINNVSKTSSEVEVFSDPVKVLKRSPPRFGFVISVLNWTLWWSVMSSVGAMLWYFPLWYMDISGYEAYLLTLFSPIILCVPPLRWFFETLPQVAFVGQMIAVIAYWEPSPPTRMMYVGIGSGFATIALATTFHSAAKSSRKWVLISQSATFVIGLLITVAIRIRMHTNNPFWPIMNSENGGQNHWGLGLGLFGALFAGTMVPDKVLKPKPKTNSFASGLGIGGLFYYFFSFMSDISALPLWCWQGYPIRGPQTIPDGILVVFAACLGLLFGVKSKVTLSNFKLSIFSISMILFTQVDHWVGFAAGLYSVFYISSVSVSLLSDAAQHNPGKSFGVGLFFTVLFYFLETWTVAYAFVPGGWLLRERIWVVVSLMYIFIIIGVLNARGNDADTLQNPESTKSSKSKSTSDFHKFKPKMICFFLALISLSASFFTYQRYILPAPVPLHPETQSFNAGIWTVHFGLDNALWTSELRMADLIRDAELDVVGLLETDTQHIVGGHRDITQKLADELGFYTDYGPAPDKHTWGCALLSRFPILKSEHHLTPSPHGELAPAIHATLLVYGEVVNIVVFHSGQEEDPLDRKLQTEYLTEVLRNTGDEPTILLSYLVTVPHQGNYNTWVSDYSGMHDIDPTDSDRWCEYILYKNIKRVAYARISRDTITDTELQVGKFQIGKEPDYSNNMISEDEVESDLRMPQLFRGEGVRGHFYHVFNEPRYFL